MHKRRRQGGHFGKVAISHFGKFNLFFLARSRVFNFLHSSDNLILLWQGSNISFWQGCAFSISYTHLTISLFGKVAISCFGKVAISRFGKFNILHSSDNLSSFWQGFANISISHTHLAISCNIWQGYSSALPSIHQVQPACTRGWRGPSAIMISINIIRKNSSGATSLHQGLEKPR